MLHLLRAPAAPPRTVPGTHPVGRRGGAGPPCRGWVRPRPGAPSGERSCLGLLELLLGERARGAELRELLDLVGRAGRRAGDAGDVATHLLVPGDRLLHRVLAHLAAARDEV